MNTNYTRYAVLTALLVVVTLAVITIFDLRYPVSVVNTTKSTELSVVGEGKMDIVPDTAYVELGVVVNNANTVNEAQKQIDKVNNGIIEKMKTLGIKKEDIKTTNYSVYPNYVYENNVNKISGYNGNVTVTVKTNDTSLVSKVIAEGTQAGANQVQNVRFSVENPAKYREEARNLAIKNAKEQANKLSKELGISLGKVVNIVESNPDSNVVYDRMMAAKPLAEGMGGGGGAQVEPGTQTIYSVVTLYFEKK